MHVAAQQLPESVEARIKYVVPGEKAIFYASEREKSYWPGEEHVVQIHNMRPEVDSLSFDRNGFVLVRHASRVQNFMDVQEIKNTYYAEATELAKYLLGAEHVIAFGEVVRSDSADTNQGRLPAYGAHVDYGDRTIRDVTRNMIGEEEAERWLKRRFILMNLWRPIRTVYRTPLALCDASTVREEDMNDSEIRGGLNDPKRASLYGFNLAYSPRHRWYYCPQMQPDEVLAFKLFDSDRSRVQWTGHTAFDDPTTARDAPPRMSIEIRTISFLPDQG